MKADPQGLKQRKMGSFVHARSLRDQGIKVRAMLALEMIGYFSDELWALTSILPGYRFQIGDETKCYQKAIRYRDTIRMNLYRFISGLKYDGDRITSLIGEGTGFIHILLVQTKIN